MGGTSHTARFAALVVGGASPVAALAVLFAIERVETAPQTYALEPLAGVVALILCDRVVAAAQAVRRGGVSGVARDVADEPQSEGHGVPACIIRPSARVTADGLTGRT